MFGKKVIVPIKNNKREKTHKKTPMLLQLRPSKRTYIDKLVIVSLLQVMKYRGIVKVCQVRHIFSFFVFWWIDLVDLFFLEILGLNFRFMYIMRNFLSQQFMLIFFLCVEDKVWSSSIRRWEIQNGRRERKKPVLVLLVERHLHRWVWHSNVVLNCVGQQLR